MSLLKGEKGKRLTAHLMLARHGHENVGNMLYLELGPVAGDDEKELDVSVEVEVGWGMLSYWTVWRG